MLVVGNGQELSSTDVPESVDLVKEEVASLEGVHPLDFPARSGELQPGMVVLDVDGLCIPSFEQLHVLVVDHRRLEHVRLVVILAISFLLHRQRRQVFATDRQFDLFVPVHPPYLALQNVRRWGQNLVDLHGGDGDIAVGLLVLESDDITGLDVSLLPLRVRVGHEELGLEWGWLLASVQKETLLGGELVRGLTEDVEEEGRGALLGLDVEEILEVDHAPGVDLAKGWLDGEPTVLCGLTEVHLAAPVLLRHDTHVHGEVTVAEQVLELHRLPVSELVADLEALLVPVVVVLAPLALDCPLDVLVNHSELVLQVLKQLLVHVRVVCPSSLGAGGLARRLVQCLLDLCTERLQLSDFVVDFATLLDLDAEEALLEEICGILGQAVVLGDDLHALVRHSIRVEEALVLEVRGGQRANFLPCASPGLRQVDGRCSFEGSGLALLLYVAVPHVLLVGQADDVSDSQLSVSLPFSHHQVALRRRRQALDLLCESLWVGEVEVTHLWLFISASNLWGSDHLRHALRCLHLRYKVGLLGGRSLEHLALADTADLRLGCAGSWLLLHLRNLSLLGS